MSMDRHTQLQQPWLFPLAVSVLNAGSVPTRPSKTNKGQIKGMEQLAFFRASNWRRRKEALSGFELSMGEFT